ncbi:PHP domain protein [Mycobacterium numidiamassiliense]|uniref:PHP domain protein n=1 Tax=Mycobacterium numidiamassiliense TaxID=1841861 RepID=A0A2U3P4N0_9MYCO|nr:CehA/McbA family metallohydrolase [Mycobacterium numidiamassiliense]SPM38726.1 PHP domain protein [Mycobacterium numidiamassiliense]
MSNPLVVHGATTEQHDDGTIEIAFSGRFGFGIYRWAYLPFHVPAGVQQIRVGTSHEDFAAAGIARNVLDLGIFGPPGFDLGNAAGFRGWSGGARDGFVISSGYATPGYLAGPIEPGIWAVALGPVVLSPWGMAWQVRVTMSGQAPAEAGQPAESDRRAVASGPAPAPPSASVGGARWYRGDLHLHTVHSDGERDPDELVSAAHAARLDFIVSTEHNTNSANRVWPRCRSGSLLIIPGEEVTTRHGHWLAVGLSAHAWVDWRYGPRDGVFGRFAAEVRQAGGLVVAAHPAVPLPGSAWEFGFGDVDALEVWNGRWNVDDEVSLRIWQRLLRQGRHIVAVGGSDSHGKHQVVGSPQTAVHAPELSIAAIVDGLRRGRSYIVGSSEVACELIATCPNSGADEVAGPGQTLRAPPGAAATVTAVISGAPGTTAALITGAGCAGRASVRSASARLQWEIDAASARFARLEVRSARRGRLGAMVALTNPVWLT